MSITYDSISIKFKEIHDFSRSQNKKIKHRAFMKYLHLVETLLEDQSITFSYTKTKSKLSSAYEHMLSFNISDECKFNIIQVGGSSKPGLGIELIHFNLSVGQCVVWIDRKYNNIIHNVKQIFDRLGDNVKCRLYLEGVQIVYDYI